MEKVRTQLYKQHDPYAGLKLVPYNDHAWENDSYINFYEVMNELRPKLIVEVGSWIGGSAFWMADAARALGFLDEIEIVCIDTWLGSIEHWGEITNFHFENGRPKLYRQFLSNMVHHNIQHVVTPFPIDSHNGLMWLGKKDIQADLVYLDGSHDYDAVKMDINDAVKLVKPGGWLMGDDYEHPPVRQAFADTLGLDKLYDRGKKVLWVNE